MKNFLATLFVLLAVTSVARAENIVQNGNFDDGAAHWTLSGFDVAPFVTPGNNVAGTGCTSHSCVDTQGKGAFISQALNTVAGVRYDLSLLVGETGGPTSEISIFWNGALIADTLNPANNTAPGGVPLLFGGLLATSSSTVLEVHGRQDPEGMYFDDFVVTAVPEPETYAMLLAGLGLVGFAARRKRVA